MKIWLIGMMGSGKSSAGELASSQLGVPFADTDRLVEERLGKSIAAFWAEHGESAFREAEREVVLGLEPASGIVATGGGAVMDEDSRAVMARSGTVVWLDARPEALAGRLDQDTVRPLLSTTKEPAEDALQLTLQERSAIYSELADHRIETDRLTTEEVAARIEAMWTL